MQGKFIVIDGTDGSGKTIQTKLLVEALERQGRTIKMMDFPRYQKPSSYFVQQYLNGKYGGAGDVSPQAACLFYALDRYDARSIISAALDEGHWIVSNRYVAANKGHQAGKASTEAEADAIVTYINHLEYTILGVIKEDINILLYTPPIVGQRLVDEKQQRLYTDEKRDIHEKDLDHLEQASKSYLRVAQQESWLIVECLRSSTFSRDEMKTLPIPELMKTIPEIHKEIMKRLEPVLLEERRPAPEKSLFV